jgi:predicted component of type VI protein secretion system
VERFLLGLRMPAQLLALTDGPSIMLDKPILLLGRHAECDIQLNSRKVSRRHCCMAQVNDYLVVRDLGSTNGIRINGKRVLEGQVRAGDELTIGNFRYQFYLDGMPVPAAPSSKSSQRSEESLLEEAEVPIPLDDRGALKGVLASKPAKAKPPTTASSDDDSGIVLPDKLRTGPQLRINSDGKR